METRRLDIAEWGAALPRAGYEVFHEPAALGVLDDHADGDLRLYGAFKGEQAVGLLPVFVAERAVGRTVFSPPISLGVPRLGPVLSPNSPKRTKRERINAELVEAVLADVDATGRATLFRMTCPTDYDPRPFQWNDLSLDPRFTYVLDLDGGDLADLLGGFSSSLRKEMRRLDDVDLTIETEGVDAARRISRDVVDRYADRDDSAPVTPGFVDDLLSALDDDHWRVYVARAPDGEDRSGIVTLYGPDTAYYWQGGVTASYDGVSVNNLLQHRILADLYEDPAFESVTAYDLVGANTEHLCEYKAKFNGDLRPYFVVESAGIEMQVAKSVYQRVANTMK